MPGRRRGYGYGVQGNTVSVERVINAPAGEYEFYCNIPGHKEAGMVGKLTVQ